MPPNSLSAPHSSRRSALKPEPPVITQSNRGFVLAFAATFDTLRLFFYFFVFFGPALAAVYCASKVGDIWLVGGLATEVCIAAAAAAGVAGAGVTVPLGILMAEAVALVGFLTLGLIIIMTNRRLFKTAATAPAWFVGAFAFGAVPFLGALPVFTVVIWRLYGAQMKAEKAAHQKWEEENAQALRQAREERAAEVAGQIQRMQQTAANDELYAETEAANEESYAEQEEAGEEKRVQTEAANDDDYIPENRYGT